MLMLLIFDGGCNCVNLSLVEVCKDLVVVVYEGIIQIVFCEVVDVLVVSDILCCEEKVLCVLVNSSNEVLKLVKVCYESGVDNYLCYFDVQCSSFFNEIVFIDGSIQWQIVLVDLFCVFGGGWDEGWSLVVYRGGRS